MVGIPSRLAQCARNGALHDHLNASGIERLQHLLRAQFGPERREGMVDEVPALGSVDVPLTWRPTGELSGCQAQIREDTVQFYPRDQSAPVVPKTQSVRVVSRARALRHGQIGGGHEHLVCVGAHGRRQLPQIVAVVRRVQGK